MGKLFLDFNFWIQGYRTVQTAHCALLTLLWINYINRLLTLFSLFGILSYCFLFLVFTSLTWKSTLHPHSRSLLCPGSWKDSRYFAFYDTLTIYTFSLCCRTVGELSCWPFENCSCASDHFLGSNSVQSN